MTRTNRTDPVRINHGVDIKTVVLAEVVRSVLLTARRTSDAQILNYAFRLFFKRRQLGLKRRDAMVQAELGQ
mgnify:CR=1 FL=1